MKNKEDYWEVTEVVPGARRDAEARRLRLQSRRLYLTAAVVGLLRGNAEKTVLLVEGAVDSGPSTACLLLTTDCVRTLGRYAT